MGVGIINTSNLNPNTLLPAGSATQGTVRGVDNNPANAAAIASAKTANAQAKTNTQKAKAVPPAQTAKPFRGYTAEEDRYLQYPADMPVYSMQMLFIPYDRTIAFENAINKHERSITLPLPANLSEGLGLKYNTVSFGPFVQQILEAASDTTTSYKSGKALGDSLSSAITKKIRAAADSSSDVLGYGFSRLAGGISDTAGAAVDMLVGTTPNPSLAVAFNGVGLRSFSYSWKFAPRSVSESTSILNIIKAIKRYALPEKNLLTLSYPHFVDIVLHPQSLNNIIKYKTCVITDIKVNWAPNGVPSFFAGTQVPTEMDVTLSFQETKIFTSEDHEGWISLTDPNPNDNSGE